MDRALLVGIGGFIGSIARYWLAGLVQRWNGTDFPVGTLAVNILGSFVLGLVVALSLDRDLISPNARLFLGVGFCGGFTTMSTFSYETIALLQGGSLVAGLGNIAASLVSCLTAVWLGDAAARLL
jgi:fluoride exporter